MTADEKERKQNDTLESTRREVEDYALSFEWVVKASRVSKVVC